MSVADYYSFISLHVPPIRTVALDDRIIELKAAEYETAVDEKPYRDEPPSRGRYHQRGHR